MLKIVGQSLQYIASIARGTVPNRTSNAPSRSDLPIAHTSTDYGPVIRDEILAGLNTGECPCLVQDGAHYEIEICEGQFDGEVFHARIKLDNGEVATVPMHPVLKAEGKRQAVFPAGRFVYADLDTQRCIDQRNPTSFIFMKGKIGAKGIFHPAADTPHAGSKWYPFIDPADRLVSFYKGGVKGGGKIGTVRVSLHGVEDVDAIVKDETIEMLRQAEGIMQETRALGIRQFANQMVDIVQSNGASRAKFWMLYDSDEAALALKEEIFCETGNPSDASRRLPLLRFAEIIVSTGGATCEEASVVALARCVAAGITATHDVSIVDSNDAFHIYAVIGDIADPGNAVVMDLWPRLQAPCTLDQYPYSPREVWVQWKAGNLSQEESDALKSIDTAASHTIPEDAVNEYLQNDEDLKGKGLQVGASLVHHIFGEEMQRQKKVADDRKEIGKLQRRHAAAKGEQKESLATTLKEFQDVLVRDEADQLRLELISINPRTRYVSPGTPDGIRFDQFEKQDWEDIQQAHQELKNWKDLYELEWLDLTPFEKLDVSVSSLGPHEMDMELDAGPSVRPIKRRKSTTMSAGDVLEGTSSTKAGADLMQSTSTTGSLAATVAAVSSSSEAISSMPTTMDNERNAIVANNMPVVFSDIISDDNKRVIEEYFKFLLQKDKDRLTTVKNKISAACHFTLALEEINAECPLSTHFLKDPKVQGVWKTPEKVLQLVPTVAKYKKELPNFFQYIVNDANYVFESGKYQIPVNFEKHQQALERIRRCLDGNSNEHVKFVSSDHSRTKSMMNDWETNTPDSRWVQPPRNLIDFARNATEIECIDHLARIGHIPGVKAPYGRLVKWARGLDDRDAQEFDACRSGESR